MTLSCIFKRVLRFSFESDVKTHLFILARHDVRHAQVRQNDGADVEDLRDGKTGSLFIQSEEDDR